MDDEARFEISRTIDAPPSAIFALLSDPVGHVSIDSSGMLMAASGKKAQGVRDRFVIHMDREALGDYPMGRYDVTVVITTFTKDKEIAWTIEGQIQPPLGHIYGYSLEPSFDGTGNEAGGTLVTSYYDWSKIDPVWKKAGIFPVISKEALRATLGILDRTVRHFAK